MRDALKVGALSMSILAIACGRSEPQIPLKLIGLIQSADETSPGTAVFRDSAAHVLYAREGDIIAGRYRVIRIRIDAVRVSLLDNPHRQATLPLTGTE
jgi:hypothetical protein